MTQAEEDGAKTALLAAGWEESEIGRLTAPELKAVVTATLRATTLMEQDYLFKAVEGRPGVYEVTSPRKMVLRKTGAREDMGSKTYTVDTTAGTCTCPFYGLYGFCKHSQGLATAINNETKEEERR